MEPRKPDVPCDNTLPELKHTLCAGASASSRSPRRRMQPAPQRPKILRQKHPAVRDKIACARFPFAREHLRVRLRPERNPVRAVDTMRPANPTAHPRQLLSAARAVRSCFAKRIPALRELGIETRLHELLRRPRAAEPADFPVLPDGEHRAGRPDDHRGDRPHRRQPARARDRRQRAALLSRGHRALRSLAGAGGLRTPSMMLC